MGSDSDVHDSSVIRPLGLVIYSGGCVIYSLVACVSAINVPFKLVRGSYMFMTYSLGF